MPFRKIRRERALENVLNYIFWLYYNENNLYSAFFTGNDNIANSKWIVIFPAKLLSLWWSAMQSAATFLWILLLNIVKTKVLLQERERLATDVACSHFGHSNTAVQNIIYEALIFDTVLKKVWCHSLCLVQRGQKIFQRSFPVCTTQVKLFFFVAL